MSKKKLPSVMRVYNRVGDAIFLWQHDRHDGALLSALIATAATARVRYRRLGDGAAFKKFLADSFLNRISVADRILKYQGKRQPIEHILWTWLRCEMVHKGSLPPDIEFMRKSVRGLSARRGDASKSMLQIPQGWFHLLIDALIFAPENKGLVGADQLSLPQ